MAPQILRRVPYSSHTSLNTLDLCLLDEGVVDKLWIIFIHGGAWRDPRSDSTDFDAAQSLLVSSPYSSKIAGLASLNYRLSPYPEFPSDDSSRKASHPDHINDVIDAIAYLQVRYGFSSNYVLAGHSAGATLAMQIAMSKEWRYFGSHNHETPPRMVQPVAVIGLCGIYDLPAMVKHHKEHPIYETFVTGAFGKSDDGGQDIWASVSPTSGIYSASTWPEGKLVLLAHSEDDELIEWEQVELMHKALVERGWSDRGTDKNRTVEVLPLRGTHEEVWQKGNEVARSIETCIDRLLHIESSFAHS